ncbi:MAG: proteasome accessory factor PafA2 family protein [Candidatus Eisenbacteria bacterium]|nr:proteasome accessory factor PafA2 family protein [Candidatus Eisenbacteria bacterium]
MSFPLMGVETEYAISGFDAAGSAVGSGALAEAMLRTAFRNLRGIPAHHGRGLFIENGGMFYIDAGAHPEFCTPECDDPLDVVRYIRAGERIVRGLAEELRGEGASARRVFLTKGNIDYSGSKNTWGCHESYGYQCRPGLMAEQIAPHLVSRIVFTGAGGFDPHSAGIVFSLSPRVYYLERGSSEVARGRAIVHRKNEPLSAGFNRLHLVCGESLSSDLASWLKIGTTALVVALIDRGLSPAARAAPLTPYRAMKAFAKDPTCRVSVPTRSGRETAISLQRRFLEAAEAHLGDGTLPPWAGKLCAAWRRVLDDLEADPARLSASLDWAIKRSLYEHRAREAGIDLDSISVWNTVLPRLMHTVRSSPFRGRRVLVEEVLAPTAPEPVRDFVEKSAPLLRRHGTRWEDLRPLVDLRRELFEIETRFPELSDEGIFAALDRAGVLRHRVPDLGDVDRALHEPPERGRARIRGREVRRLAGEPRNGYLCDWDRIGDIRRRQVLDLSDPYAESAEWKPIGEAPPERIRLFPF